MNSALFPDDPLVAPPKRETAEQLAARFVMRWVPRVQQAAAMAEMQALIAAIRSQG